MAKKCVIIIVTCASRKEASEIIGVLLRKRLVACANILGNIHSRFWWMGRLDTANEVMVLCKTTAANFTSVSRAVKDIHSYKVPEIIAVPIVAGDKSYLEWIEDSVK